MSTPTPNKFSQSNAFAMWHGLMLGMYEIVLFAMGIYGISHPTMSLLQSVGMIVLAVLPFLLTQRFRRLIGDKVTPFTFSQGFSHTLLTVIYAAFWLSLCVWVYFSYIDHGFLCDSYLARLQSPEMIDYMKASGLTEEIAMLTDGRAPADVVEMMRDITPVDYASMALSLSFIVSVPVSLLAGIIYKRKGQTSQQ